MQQRDKKVSGGERQLKQKFELLKRFFTSHGKVKKETRKR